VWQCARVYRPIDGGKQASSASSAASKAGFISKSTTAVKGPLLANLAAALLPLPAAGGWKCRRANHRSDWPSLAPKSTKTLRAPQPPGAAVALDRHDRADDACSSGG